MEATVTTWHNCYDDGWKGLIVPEAFAHPAKFARGLIARIIDHGMDAGWWKQGDLIGDPFGGVALGGVIAGYSGLNWIGVELEDKFWKLGNRNIELHGPKWCALDLCSRIQLVNGDSRRFAELIGAAAAVITSPPYGSSLTPGNKAEVRDCKWSEIGGGQMKYRQRYSTETEGQIGNLETGALDAVLTSPPYADQVIRKRELGKDGFKQGATQGGHSFDAYGESAGQIGRMKPGVIDHVITSPPYNKPFSQDHNGSRGGKRANGEAPSSERGAFIQYGQTAGQIEGVSPETYWQAMDQVYRQCLLALRPGGVCVVNVKDYVQNKKRVGLCDDTMRLLQHVGFEPVERIHAMLTKTTRTPALFGGEHVVTKERKSFFRRIAEKKGSPRIDYEEVLVVRKP